MITLIATILFNIAPANYCDDVYDELMVAVDIDILTLREAEDIYRKCLITE